VTHIAVRRRGFVLPTVLFSIAVLSVAAFSLSSEARTSTVAATNRVSKVRAQWEARGCLALARAEAQEIFVRAPDGFERDLIWRTLRSELRRVPSPPRGCHVALEQSGVRVNVNRLDSLELSRLLVAVGTETAVARGVAALLDWRDTDDVPRAGGAERAWYRQHGRLLPRNGSLRSCPELAQVRGFERLGQLCQLVSFEDELVSLSDAPSEVIAALAGEDPVVLVHLLRQRESASEARTLNDLFWSPDSVVAHHLLAALSKLSDRLTLTPAHWRAIVIVQSDNGMSVHLEQHWVRTRDEVVLQAERLR
jgi:hypothetical protein